MKIGIFTLSAGDNCGTLLQCYALKSLLQNYGEVEVINFSTEKLHRMYDAIPKRISLREWIIRMVNRKKLYVSKAAYERFRRNNLKICGKEITPSSLNEIADRYDVIVAGSDQIWNVRMFDFDEAFFLGWTNTKKVAYAPSMGGSHLNYSPNYLTIKSWIEEFDSLSVRERDGQTCLKEVLGKEVDVVLDPTLAVDETVFYELADDRLVDGDYIFFYSWAYETEETIKIVCDEAAKLGLPVYVVDPRKWIKKSPKKYGFNLYSGVGPIEYLKLMKYAKRCYVESFHGLVFAYLFHKDFWVLDTEPRIEDLDSRMLEFVRILGAEDRILTPYNVSEIDQNSPVLYKKNELLDRMKKASLKYLDEALYT